MLTQKYSKYGENILNFQDKNFKEALYFVTKALFISAIFIFTYHLTIGVAIKK